ncbi:MAG: TRAP transporter large permease [Deltaproteobacteria bacterium]|nr:TRAP transporter large permease [Deltaproteobacteria bacterium]MBW2341906.1 TRAP transporter large permease [Deltaproteobacteria bacterium]
MEWYFGAGLVALAILTLLAMRMPLGFVFGVVGAAGIVITTGRFSVLTAVAQSLHDMLSDFVLITVPLFVLMAELLSAGEFIPELYTSFEKLAGRLRGSLSIATIVASAMFAAVCGSSYVTAASLGKMTLPEMLDRAYKKELASGSVAAGGSLGILIPPSLAFVIYGYMSGASIAALFIAGIIPGFILAGLFVVSIIVWTKLSPAIAGTGYRVSWGEKFRSLIKIIPVALLAVFLLAIIYLGMSTPAEAAALGCLFSVLLCLFYRKLKWKMLIEGVRRTVATSGFLLLLMGTAKILGFMMAKAGIMYGLQGILTALPKSIFVLVLYFTVAFMGLFLEGTSIIVLTTPIFAPAVSAVGLDLVWYGVVLVLFIEIALLTPPVGMNCYIVAEIGKSFGIKLEDVFRGVMPFLIALAIAVVLVTLLPNLALWLPSTMR